MDMSLVVCSSYVLVAQEKKYNSKYIIGVFVDTQSLLTPFYHTPHIKVHALNIML
jgi:hypothetical protein